MGHKGSWDRTKDRERYRSNHERIFNRGRTEVPECSACTMPITYAHLCKRVACPHKEDE
jgi:hypothetical protein